MRRMAEEKGFTLVELLVVISIISLLSSVVFASLNSSRAKARDARRRADVKQVQTALELYYDANSIYPLPSDRNDNIGYDWEILGDLLAPYLSRIPRDPRGDSWHRIEYVRGPDKNSYGILIRLESVGECKVGVNVNPGWWTPAAIPFCA